MSPKKMKKPGNFGNLIKAIPQGFSSINRTLSGVQHPAMSLC